MRLFPITEMWSHGFGESRPVYRFEGKDDFVTYSAPYTKSCGEPVWFYGSGNWIWLRCPVRIFTTATIRRRVDFAHGPGWGWVIQ